MKKFFFWSKLLKAFHSAREQQHIDNGRKWNLRRAMKWLHVCFLLRMENGERKGRNTFFQLSSSSTMAPCWLSSYFYPITDLIKTYFIFYFILLSLSVFIFNTVVPKIFLSILFRLFLCVLIEKNSFQKLN